jgi:hypothetical protein
MIKSLGQFLVMAWRWVLPLLTAVGHDTSQSLTTLGGDEGVGVLKHVGPGDLDTSFGSNGKMRTHF